MIRFIPYEEIDKDKWDDCITNASNSLIYGYSWYLDVVCKRWDALVEDDYKSVFPLNNNKKFGFHYIFQPYFTQQLGVFSISPVDESKIIEFIEAIPPKYPYIEINLNMGNKLDNIKYPIEPQLNHLLPLNKPYEELAKSYSKNAQRNIKNAGESNLTPVFHIAPDEIIELFRIYKGKQLKHLKTSNYLTLKELIHVLIDRNLVVYAGVYTSHHELCAATVWVKHKNRAIFLFSAVSPDARETGAMSWLIDSYIKKHAGSEVIIDFEGSNDPGLARFYKSFGSVEEHYYRLKINNLPPLAKMVKK